MALEDVLEAVPQLRGAPRRRAARRRPHEHELQGHDRRRRVRRPHLRQGHGAARDRPRERDPQHDRGVRDRRRRAVRRRPAGAGRARARVHGRRDDEPESCCAAATGSGRSPTSCRRLHAGRRFLHDFDMFEIQRGYVEVVRERGFRLPERYDEFEPQVRALEAAMRVRPGADGPVQQRPARGELHRGGRRAAADRLRVLRQQRADVRARQRLERVEPVARAARGARRRVLRAAAAEQGRARPPLGPDVEVRLDALGLDPGRHLRRSTSTSGAGRWRSTSAPSRSSTARISSGCSTRCRARTERGDFRRPSRSASPI